MPERKARDEEFEQLLEKYNVDEIEAKPKNFYSHVCNRWASLSGVSININSCYNFQNYVMLHNAKLSFLIHNVYLKFCIQLILMFLINWGYSILCMAICIGIWWYIGMTTPGSNPGIASEFSMITYIHDLIARMMG